MFKATLLEQSRPFVGLLTMLFLSLSSSCGVKRLQSSQASTPAVPISTIDTLKVKDGPGQVQRLQIDSALAFQEVLKEKRPILNYADQIESYYRQNNYKPILVPQLLKDEQLEGLIGYLKDTIHHGLKSEYFMPGELEKAMADLQNTAATNNLSLYKNQVALELLAANSLLKYSIILQFGAVKPQEIDTNYYTPTRTADSIFIRDVFEANNIKNYLDSIQPTGKQYLALQKALLSGTIIPGKTLTDTKNILIVNLERLRWKNKSNESKYVWVNIADFTLNVMDQGKSVLKMKVCVGDAEGWHTPQLTSKIHSVQVNPVWNVPVSIARTEISRNVIRNPYYLANKEIEVYQNGKRIDPNGIDWSVTDAGTYSFKQMPGEQNALGKIKFLFNNLSSIYLHDTPNQSAFRKNNRAISHGCIRVENPLKLAQSLFGEGPKYEAIKKAMQSGYPRAKYIGLPQQIPVIVSYFTAFVNEAGVLQFCKDIYGLDEPILNALNDVDKR